MPFNTFVATLLARVYFLCGSSLGRIRVNLSQSHLSVFCPFLISTIRSLVLFYIVLSLKLKDYHELLCLVGAIFGSCTVKADTPSSLLEFVRAFKIIVASHAYVYVSSISASDSTVCVKLKHLTHFTNKLLQCSICVLE